VAETPERLSRTFIGIVFVEVLTIVALYVAGKYFAS